MMTTDLLCITALLVDHSTCVRTCVQQLVLGDDTIRFSDVPVSASFVCAGCTSEVFHTQAHRDTAETFLMTGRQLKPLLNTSHVC